VSDMGFSVAAASAVIMMGLVIFIGVTTSSIIYSMNQLMVLLQDSSAQRLNVLISVEITEINASSIEFYVKNDGSKTIFLRNQDYNWNSIVVSYRNGTWHSYLIEDYEISEIKVQDSTLTFNVSIHAYINPGEEARILARLPDDAPEIPVNETVIVVFISHHGVSAMSEGVRSS